MFKRSNFERREADLTPRARDTDPRRPAAGNPKGNPITTFSDNSGQIAVRRIQLGSINVKVDRLRALHDDTVKGLMESMAVNGLLQLMRRRG
jgi:hypothetical protein